MENAQLIGLSRQVALRRQMDVVANNMANLNTTGFKAESMLFEEYIMPGAADRDFQLPDQQLSFTQDWATIHDFRAGSIFQTGNDLDIALEGEGFLVVQTEAGERYTRNGALTLNNLGELVTAEGDRVVSDGGFMVFDASETNIAIGKDGSVRSSAGAKGTLRIVEFENPQDLTREGDTMFAGDNPQIATNTRVIQGAIERSNVSGVAEMTEMMRITRAYTSLAQLMQRQDQLRSSAIQKLGTLSA